MDLTVTNAVFFLSLVMVANAECKSIGATLLMRGNAYMHGILNMSAFPTNTSEWSNSQSYRIEPVTSPLYKIELIALDFQSLFMASDWSSILLSSCADSQNLRAISLILPGSIEKDNLVKLSECCVTLDIEARLGFPGASLCWYAKQQDVNAFNITTAKFDNPDKDKVFIEILLTALMIIVAVTVLAIGWYLRNRYRCLKENPRHHPQMRGRGRSQRVVQRIYTSQFAQPPDYWVAVQNQSLPSYEDIIQSDNSDLVSGISQRIPLNPSNFMDQRLPPESQRNEESPDVTGYGCMVTSAACLRRDDPLSASNNQLVVSEETLETEFGGTAVNQ